MFEQIFFWLLSGGAIVTAAMVVLPPTGRNPLYAALALVVSFFFMAGIYALLLAHLMAVLQVMVYAGAIMVLFMFVIMLLNLREDELGTERRTFAKLLGGVAMVWVGLKVALVASAVDNLPAADATTPAMASFGTVEGVGDMLFRQFLFPFELTSILLLIAVIGAVVLAKRTL